MKLRSKLRGKGGQVEEGEGSKAFSAFPVTPDFGAQITKTPSSRSPLTSDFEKWKLSGV